MTLDRVPVIGVVAAICRNSLDRAVAWRLATLAGFTLFVYGSTNGLGVGALPVIFGLFIFLGIRKEIEKPAANGDGKALGLAFSCFGAILVGQMMIMGVLNTLIADSGLVLFCHVLTHHSDIFAIPAQKD